MSQPVKEFWKSVNIWGSYEQEFGVLFFLRHGVYSFRVFFVFVCLCAAIYGVIKNNNLVRLSSIVPFHSIYQVNLYWRNNSAHKYNYFETLFQTLAFHTNFSRIFHPCKLVPYFHVSHFPPLQSGAENSCLAFSTPAFLTVSHFQSPLWTVSLECTHSELSDLVRCNVCSQSN